MECSPASDLAPAIPAEREPARSRLFTEVFRISGILGLVGLFFFGAPAAPAGAQTAPPAPSDPGRVVALLQWCWQNRDANRYREIFTDDFRFTFGPGDPTGDSYPDHAWTRDDELVASTHLFTGGGAEPPATLIALSFDGSAQPGSSSIPGKTYPWHQQILIPSLTLQVTRSDGSTRTGSGPVFFSVVRGDSAVIPQELVARGFTADPNRWYIERWDDVPGSEGVVDHAPVVTAAATLTARVGMPFTMHAWAADPDGDPITSLTAAAPPGASFSPSPGNATGMLSWIPAAGDLGSHPVTFTAANALSATVVTILNVLPLNQPPIVSVVVSPNTGMEPLLVRVDASGSTDPDGSIASFLFAFGDGTSVTQGYPVVTHTYRAGKPVVTVTATDNLGLTGWARDSLDVQAFNRSPVASLVASPTTGKEPLTVRFDASGSRDTDGRIASYRFDFGDGTSAVQDGAVATHTYSAGSWGAKVTVTDEKGATGSTSATIGVESTNLPPIASLVARPTTGKEPLLVQLDASQSTDPDGTIATYRFSFGDGTSTTQSGAIATHTYGAGQWAAVVTATDNRGATSWRSVVITVSSSTNQWPTASLVARPATGAEPLLVQLDASGSTDSDGTIASYRFDFGDGTAITQGGPITTHTYADGTRTATATVTDDRGATASATVLIDVRSTNRPPVASLVLSPATGIEPLLVTADASGSTDSDGTIASYRFDFGDGTILTQAGPVATHTFGAGQVAVAVTARDNQGAAGSVMANLSVSPSSEPPVPNGAASALALLKWCWSKRDASRYREVFTDDFRFAFGPGDPTGDPYPDHAWTRDAELLAVTHLFVGGVAEPPATGVALTFKGNPQPGSSFVPGRPYPWHQQILIPSLTMEVARSDGTTLIATGRALFHLVRGDSAAIPQELIARGFKPDSTRWYVEGWEDVPAVETAVDHAPVVTAPATVNARAGTPITISVSATDPDGDPIESLRATGIGWGIFMAGDNRTGVLTWTPAEGDVGARPMTFLASNALTGFARTMVYVTSAEPNLVRNPSFENDTRGWGPYAGSSLLRVQGGNEGAYALQITGPSVLNGSFGANDSPDWIRPTMAAGQRYRYGAWVRAASGAGTARLRVSEYRILTGAKLGQATSLGVKLTPDWQMITVDYLTTSAGSTLDFQVRDFDAVPGEVFLADDIQIRDVTVAAAAQPWSGDPVSEWEGGEGIALEPTLYPSPVHDRGILGFSTPKAGALRVEILDLAGRRVRRLMDERDAPAGMHFVTIRRTGDDGGRLGAGVYFYRIEAEEGVKTGRFVMLR